MNQIATSCIVLSRINFGEADRIVTVLTPDHGKLRLMAKGVRKSVSKLAGGIELFSISHITFIRGRGEICTLISTRLKHHYGNIVKDINRTMLGYDILKMVNRGTEDNTAKEYFLLVDSALEALNDLNCPTQIIELWFYSRMLKMSGHAPNFSTVTGNQAPSGQQHYSFDINKMAFWPHAQGPYNDRHIKLMRLSLAATSPAVLQRVEGIEGILPSCVQLAKTMLSTNVRI